VKDFNAGDGMDFIPTVIAISDVGAGDADTIADIGDRHLRMKIAACRLVIGIVWSVLANYFHYQVAVRVN
jgi:hypothetical protein